MDDCDVCTPTIQLPRWQSHKKVWADKIVGISKADNNQQPVMPDDSGIVWHLACGAFIHVSFALIARGSPSVGDYYVLYEDSYQSWSPAKAFDSGYTRLP